MARSKKEKILHGALQAFSEYGYRNTTMDIIAEQADVAKRTLYNYFKTKEELFVYVNENGIEMLMDSITCAINDTSQSLSDRLVIVLDEHIRFFTEKRELCKLLICCSSGDQERDQILRKILAVYFQKMEVFLASLQQKGYIDANLEVPTLASAMFGMVGLTVGRKLYHHESFQTDQTKETLIAMLKGAIHPPKEEE